MEDYYKQTKYFAIRSELGQMGYTDNIEKTFKKCFKDNVYVIDGQKITRKFGNACAANVVFMGAFLNFNSDLSSAGIKIMI